MHVRWIPHLFVAASLLRCAATSSPAPAPSVTPQASTRTAQPAPAAALPPLLATEAAIAQSDRQTPGLQIEVACSATERGVAVARIRWRGSPAAAQRQRLDFTVFRDGFERGWWATVPVSGDAKAAAFGPRMSSLGRAPGRAFQIEARPLGARATAAEEKETVGVEVRRLEPGVVYWWRVVTQTPQGMVADVPAPVEAPVCPVDRVKEQ